jgi:hypothetical protein
MKARSLRSNQSILLDSELFAFISELFAFYSDFFAFYSDFFAFNYFVFDTDLS